MSEPPPGSGSRPPKREGVKPRAMKPDDGIPKGKLPAKRKPGRKAKAPAAPVWDPAKEAEAAKAAVLAKSKRKATVLISPPIDVSSREKPRSSAKSRAKDPLPPAKTILGEVAREAAADPIRLRLETLRKKAGVPMTEEIFGEILLLLADGLTLREILRSPSMPSKSGFYNWLEDDADPVLHRGRLARHARARALGMDEIAAESLEIVDDGTNDFMERRRDDGTTEEVVDREHIARSKLRAEHRLKLLGLWDPVRYGSSLKLSDPDGRPIDKGGLSVSDLAIGIAKIAAALPAPPASGQVIEG